MTAALLAAVTIAAAQENAPHPTPSHENPAAGAVADQDAEVQDAPASAVVDGENGETATETAIAAAAEARNSEAPMPFTILLDLATAQRRALNDNPSLQAAAERVAQTQQLKAQARSLYFPQVSADYTYTRSELPDYITDPAGGYLGEVEDIVGDIRRQLRFGPLALLLSPRERHDARTLARDTDDFIARLRDRVDEPLDAYSLDFSAAYLVFDGFSREFKQAMARYGVQQTRAARREGQRLLLDAVAQAFFGVQLGREQVQLAKADIAFNEKLFHDAKARRRHGRGSTSDMLNFEVALRAARTAKLRAEKNFQSARIALATLMAMPDARMPDNMSVAPLPEETPALMKEPDTHAMIATALAQRPDLAGQAYGVKRAEAAVREQYAAFSPQVGAFVNYQAQRYNGTDVHREDFATTIGVNVHYDLFNGGRRLAKVREAKHARREAELTLRDKELEVTSEVQQALLDLRIAQEQLVLQRTTVEKVRKNRNLVAKSYEAGKEMLARLNQAQRDLTRAEGQLAQARVELQSAWHSLHIAAAHNLEAGGTGHSNQQVADPEVRRANSTVQPEGPP